ncbi:MAG TPA: S53 family peptidase [Mycobacteriales bacterium]|nr:S53 family peptidase [Mycobacteriales bacterium]
MRKTMRLAAAGATLPLIAAALTTVGTAAQAGNRPTAVPGGDSEWTRSTPAVGHSPTRPLSFTVYLAPRGGQQALNAAVHDVSTPGSPTFRHFLTPAQYRDQFEPTTANVDSVTGWLRSAGMKVTGIEASRRFVQVAASVAQAEKAFGTTLNTYRHDGQTVVAPAVPATIPASIAPAVAAVSGLDSTVHAVKHTSTAPPAFVNARPCSLSYGQLPAKYEADYKTRLPKFQGNILDYAVCGYVPVQLRSAYEGNSTLDGSGTTVAIVDAFAADTITGDANTYATRHGDSAFAPRQFSQHNSRVFKYDPTVCQSPSSWAGEETLDVEAVHGMAPAAKVRYYGAKDCTDQSLAAALTNVVDENKASIVTNSYGGPDQGATPDVIVAYEQAFQQGAMQGIGFFFSSGDNGDEVSATGLMQTDYPSSDPYVTSVGGTSTAIDGAGSLAFATGWGTDKYNLSGKSWTPIPGKFLYGAGGGYSTLFNRPDYQNGVVPAAAGPGRAVPDVAMDADPTTGMLVGETQAFPSGDAYGEYRIGGTSLASPLMAGMQALASQNAGGRLGFANPAIYQAAGGPTFTDVTSVHHGDGNVRPDYINGLDPSAGVKYSVRTFDQDSSLFTAPGWDDVTGVGSPNASYLTSQVATP